MIKIVVDCEENDPVDINAGGPMWLGFDFYINDTDNIEEYKSFIKEELKKNITVFNENAVDLIKNSDLYKFNYKMEKDTDKQHIGFIIGDGYKTPLQIISNDGNAIDSYSMSSILWKAIQEQQEQIEELKEEINKLKGEK